MRVRKIVPLCFLHLIAILLVVLITGIITTSSQLLFKNTQSKNDITRLSNGYYSYTLIDTLFEDDDFYKFRTDKKSLNTLRVFYNSLYQSKDLELLSTFNQPLFIKSFDKGEEFLYDQGVSTTQENNQEPKAVNSFQISQKAFDFYNIQIEDGEKIDWEAITLSDFESYPVLLGSRFHEHYKIGDKITAEFYMKEVIFEVKGFLEPNSYVYYKGNSEFYLDNYIIVPYPLELQEIGTKDFTFEGILYFAMINSQFVTRLPTNKVLTVLREQSEKSEFYAFSTLGVDDFTIKYGQLLSVISHLQLLLIVLLVILCMLFFYLIINILLYLLRYQKDIICISWLIGYNVKNKILLRTCSLLYSLSLMTCFCIEVILFKQIFVLPIMMISNLIMYATVYHMLIKITGYE